MHASFSVSWGWSKKDFHQFWPILSLNFFIHSPSRRDFFCAGRGGWGQTIKKQNVRFSCQFKHFGTTLIFFIFTRFFLSSNPKIQFSRHFSQFGTTIFSFVTKFLISSIYLGVGRGKQIMNNFWTNHLLGRGVTNFVYHFSCSRKNWLHTQDFRPLNHPFL